MNFLEKVEPYITSDDYLVQEFVFHALQDYPNVPEEWITRLLKEAVHNKERESSILVFVAKHQLNEEAIKVLIEGLEKAEKSKMHLYTRFLGNIEPALAIKYKNELTPYYTKETWDFYHLLVNGTEDEVWNAYGEIINKLERAPEYNHALFIKAKKVANTLVQKGWIDKNEIALILSENLNKDWFSFDGILAVYMIGLLKLETHIPILASLLTRDEDILLEETADVLIAFQSEEVVRAVEPYLKRSESIIFATSVVGNTKTSLSVEVLRSAYHHVTEEDDKDSIFEALCHQLSSDCLSEIEDYLANEPESFMIEVDQVAYGYFTVMGLQHPKLLEWKQAAEEREKYFWEEMNKSNSNILPFTSAPHQSADKVGRNDPCPCGSGKKYKKCCLN
jgi:hypothetical protein